MERLKARTAEETETNRRESEEALNYREQTANLKSRLRKLNLERGVNALRANRPLLMIGSALGLMLMRRYKLGSAVLISLLVEKALGIKEKGPTRTPKEIELERYAVKLELGDYGKMEVIPFR